MIDGVLWMPPGRHPVRILARAVRGGVRLETAPGTIAAGGWFWIGQALSKMDLPFGAVEVPVGLLRQPSADALSWLRRERPLCEALEEVARTEGLALCGTPWDVEILDDASCASLARVRIHGGGASVALDAGALPLQPPEDHPWPDAWRIAVLAHRTRAVRAALGLCAPDCRVAPWLSGWHRLDVAPTGPWRVGRIGADPLSAARIVAQIAAASAA
jgi:hypothetical protein